MGSRYRRENAGSSGSARSRAQALRPAGYQASRNAQREAVRQGRKDLAHGRITSAQYDEMYGDSLSAEDIGTQQAVLPEKPFNDPGNLAVANNFGLSNMMSSLGYSIDNKGQFVSSNIGGGSTTPTDGGDNYQRNFESYLKMAGANTPVNQSKIYSDLERESGLRQKQQLVSSYTSQLNSIVAKAQADQLAVTGQGRGIPEVIIGGQQAQINKEAAIQALPVQAQLSAAQGDLQMAQQHVDQMFQIRVTDAQNAYNYKAKVIDSLFEFANSQETRRLQAAKDASSSNMTLLQNAINFNQQIAAQALQNGNTAAFSQLTKIVPPDPNSKTFAADLAAYNSKLAQYGSVGSGVSSDRPLSLDEAAKYGVPYGTMLSDLTGQIPGGGAGANTTLKKQLDEDFATVSSARQTIEGVLSKIGKTPENVQVGDLGKLSNTDAESIGKALFLMQNPGSSKVGDYGDALKANSLFGVGTQFVRNKFTGKKYLKKEILGAIQSANDLYNQRLRTYQTSGGAAPSFSVTAPDGSGDIIIFED